MGKRLKTELITVGELMDYIDYNREGYEAVLICDNGDDRWSKVFTDSAMLDGIADRTVNSIGAKDDMVCIWLNDEE